MTVVGNVILNSFQDLMNKWIPYRARNDIGEKWIPYQARNDIGGNGFRVKVRNDSWCKIDSEPSSE